jgi:hypothetical protein
MKLPFSLVYPAMLSGYQLLMLKASLTVGAFSDIWDSNCDLQASVTRKIPTLH